MPKHLPRRMPRLFVALLGLILASAAAAPALAGALDPYKAQGLVGERPDGYAGVVPDTAPADVAAKVRAINDARRAEYQRLAKERGTSLEAVQAVFGQKLIQQTPPGQYYMNASGQWVKK